MTLPVGVAWQVGCGGDPAGEWLRWWSICVPGCGSGMCLFWGVAGGRRWCWVGGCR